MSALDLVKALYFMGGTNQFDAFTGLFILLEIWLGE